MKILYAVQGTGNGHITRAMEIIPHLKKRGTTDILVSGIQSDLELPFPVKYKFNGLSFIFGKQGGVDIWKTYIKLNSRLLISEIRKLPVHEYDLIISDFEPVSAWACLKAKRASVGLSNQVATLHPMAPKPKKSDLLGKIVLEKYAPTTFNYGFHFKALDKNIFTPVIRKEVRLAEPSNKGHITVYLPSYDDERILKQLTKMKDVEWQVFSKHNKMKFRKKNVHIQPPDGRLFLKSMASSAGVLCNAGFGSTSEALFLKKKLLVIPMKTQYEQHCNATMLKSMGVTVIKKLKKKHGETILDWLYHGETVKVNYPDLTAKIVDTIIGNHAGHIKMDEEIDHADYPIFQ